MYSSKFTTMFRNMSLKNIKNTDFTKLQTLLSSILMEITIISEYKTSMSMVNWTNNKLSEGCGQEESGIKVLCLHPQCYCCIHVEKPHVPMGAICEAQQPLGKSRQLTGNSGLQTSFCFLCVKALGTDTAFIDVKAKSHTATGGGPKPILTDIWKGYRTGTALLRSMQVLKSYRNNVYL